MAESAGATPALSHLTGNARERLGWIVHLSLWVQSRERQTKILQR
ncbi:hypothetical protein ACFPU1_09460 [Thalassorhabdus alkalitolerans]|uniref:Uncharacterized protein n=1 Tax=Thalassorhabdus alkalitolerans TaxID=2282697 RepID=A0ABW0YKP6_9BACI|nr:hypothetical protein [Thalassobacillus sp. C254]